MIKRIIRLVMTSMVLVAPFILLLLPANFFDSGASLCISKSLLNLECFGCGLTRAMQHLIHFDIKQAWILNKLSFVILPIFCYVWFKEVVKVYRKIKI